MRYTRMRDSLRILINDIKRAQFSRRVRGTRGTTTRLVSHKRRNCQGFLTEAITFSTDWEIMAWREAVVRLLRVRGSALGRLPLSLYDLLLSGNLLQQLSSKVTRLMTKSTRGAIVNRTRALGPLNHLSHLKSCLCG